MKSVIRMRRPAWMVLGGALLLGACGMKDAGEPEAGPPVMRRLTDEQYRRSITDIFGADIKVAGSPMPENREAGLLAVGSANASIPPSILEQRIANARVVAAQVTDAAHRRTIIGCAETAPGVADEVCLEQFIADAGRFLYRRPLDPAELQAQLALADEAATKLADPYAGVEASLASMLAAPQFLFRWEHAEPDPEHDGASRLNAFSKASRLSFFLWDAAPDEDLLKAAESGELHTETGWRHQVERLLASPRLQDGVRAFFADMLKFDAFAGFSRDQALFPNYSNFVATEAQEQTLRTITDVLLARDGDYRDLFTTRSTFLTRHLGALYDLPVTAPDGWTRHEFGEGDPHAAGILLHLSFIGLHSHPGRSSPTLRGEALREILLCQKVPDPPGDVDFSNFEAAATSGVNTARERLAAHASVPACAGCHKITDPIGLAMEQFDTVGKYRARENGAAIDAEGDLDGVAFTDAVGLGQAMRDNPAVPSCLVNRVYSYAVGRSLTAPERDWLKRGVEAKFVEQKYRFIPLLERIASSAAFTNVTERDTRSQTVAAVNTIGGGQQ